MKKKQKKIKKIEKLKKKRDKALYKIAIGNENMNFPLTEFLNSRRFHK